jgi:hypothetical protein
MIHADAIIDQHCVDHFCIGDDRLHIGIECCADIATDRYTCANGHATTDRADRRSE